MMRTCDVAGCEKKHAAKGLCRNHYYQAQRTANPAPSRECGRRHDANNREKRRDKNRRWHAANAEYVAERKRETRAERGKLIDDVKRSPCGDCGGTFPPYCMDLHHRDPAQKVASVRALTTHRIEVLMAELEQCDVLCAICHRKRHHGAA